MALGRVFDIFASIVTLAITVVVVTSPETAHIITAWGTAFSTSLKAATGK